MAFTRDNSDLKKSLNIGQSALYLDKLKDKAKNHPGYDNSGDENSDLWIWAEAYGTLKEYKYVIEDTDILNNGAMETKEKSENWHLQRSIMTIIIGWEPVRTGEFYIRYAKQKLIYLLDRGIKPKEEELSFIRNQEVKEILRSYNIEI